MDMMYVKLICDIPQYIDIPSSMLKIQISDNEKDNGFLVEQSMNVGTHLSARSNKTNAMFAMLRKSFQHLNKKKTLTTL